MVGPLHPPLNFVDGNGYIVLRGVTRAMDCEVGCGKVMVMRVWGFGDEKVLGKFFELLFNAGRSQQQARDPEHPGRWQSKSSLPQGVGWGPLQEVPHTPLWKVSLRSGTSTQ